MPIAPPKPCRATGCPELTRDKSGYCQKHKKQTATIRPYEKRDPFYASSRWIKLSRWYRKQNPICEICNEAPSVMVHHKTPRADGGEDMAVDNLQAVCLYCHGREHRKKVA